MLYVLEVSSIQNISREFYHKARFKSLGATFTLQELAYDPVSRRSHLGSCHCFPRGLSS